MKTARTNSRPRFQAGFTLIEIMVVVAILGVLVALVGPQIFGQQKEANVKATKVQIRSIEGALDLYRLKYNQYPETLESLVNPPEGDPFMKNAPKDAWGNEFEYAGGADGYKITSMGPDRKLGSSDDISNED